MTAIKVWNGSSWEFLGAAPVAQVQASAPSGPAIGQFWLDTDELAQGAGNGPYVCTSSTRPAHQVGLTIYESDTDRVYISNGTIWRYLYGGTDPTSVRAWANANTSLSTGVFTIVGFAVEEYDYGNNFSANAYTCPRDGRLFVSSSVQVSSAAGERVVCSIYNSNTEAARGTDGSMGGTNGSAHVSTSIPVTAGDTITIKVWHSGTGRGVVTGQALSYVTCWMIP